jgi:hypothetical protein
MAARWERTLRFTLGRLMQSLPTRHVANETLKLMDGKVQMEVNEDTSSC